MKVSDIAIHAPANLRTITLQYDNRTHVMEHAMRIYVQVGCDCEINHLTITYNAPAPAAQYLAGLFELCTGHPATIQ